MNKRDFSTGSKFGFQDGGILELKTELGSGILLMAQRFLFIQFTSILATFSCFAVESSKIGNSSELPLILLLFLADHYHETQEIGPVILKSDRYLASELRIRAAYCSRPNDLSVSLLEQGDIRVP